MINTTQTWWIGDCVELMQDIPDNSIDLIFTDPPYGINYHSGYYKHGNPFDHIKNDYMFDIKFNNKWLKMCSQKAKNNSSLLLFTSYQVLTDWINIIKEYWNIKNIIIWVKNNWTAGDLKGNLGNQYEMIIFATKGKFTINSYRYTNVWHFDRVPPKYHPTTKPIPLIKQGVDFTTKEGDLVFDPFLGSGTTLEACRLTNRNCIGFEISDEWEKYYPNRILQHNKKLTEWF